MVEIAHQRGARLPAGHVPRRTAHIDVDDGSAAGLGDTRGLPHPARLAAGQLHHVCAQTSALNAQPRVGAALGERRTRRHFGDHQARPKVSHEAPKRGVGYSRHRRQNHWVRQRDIADDDRPEAGKRHHWRHLASLPTN